MPAYPLEVTALCVEQPIGVFYVAALPARTLLDVAFSDVLSATLAGGKDTYQLSGTQRVLQPERLRQIADYIDRSDAAFPNSIIVAANFREEDGLIEGDESNSNDSVLDEGGNAAQRPERRWSVRQENDGCYRLTIPTGEKLAAIIDGQHRLFAFVNARPERLDMTLLCAVFLDLPKPFQAQIFATINSTQKRVDRSLTYELFGYNIEEEVEEYWSPDKLAVFLTRKLGTDGGSPLRGRITVAPILDEGLARLREGATWRVSTAVVVDGIMRLISTNPKKDTTALLVGGRKKRSALASGRRDRSPLREAYIQGQDAVIYTMTLNFLKACEEVFWARARNDSFIHRTVGVQALFDILRQVAARAYEEKDISAKHFVSLLAPAAGINFAEDQYRNASGAGRSAIRNAIAERIVGM